MSEQEKGILKYLRQEYENDPALTFYVEGIARSCGLDESTAELALKSLELVDLVEECVWGGGWRANPIPGPPGAMGA